MPATRRRAAGSEAIPSRRDDPKAELAGTVRTLSKEVREAAETRIRETVENVMGPGSIETEAKPIMGAEDFAFMLEARPGAMIFLGNGDTAFCHNPEYDFNDAVIPVGVRYWVRLAEMVLKP